MEMLEYYISQMCLVWVLHSIINAVFKRQLDNLLDNNTKTIRLTATAVVCCKCFAFWFGLGLTLDIWQAAIISAGTYLLTIIINKNTITKL